MSEKNSSNKVPLIDFMPEGEKALQILRARAELLKKTDEAKDSDKEAQNRISYVRFKVGRQEHYGIAYPYIKEVMQNMPATRVPHSPGYIAGVINRYGVLLSVLDLRAFFRLSIASSDLQSHLIVVEASGMTLAILADHIESSSSYDKTRLNTPLGTEDAVKAKYVVGLHQGLTTILNIEALLLDLQAQTTPFKEDVL